MGFKSLKPEAKTQVNRFSLTVGTSGNTTYILGQTFPAGNYTIEFSNGDTTYDIYAIGTDGTNVGYANGAMLIATADINEIVVLGAADNEVITFENIVFTVAGGSETPVAPSSKGDVASAGAFITSVSVSSLPNANDTTTITGGNFASDVQVFFTGQDSVELEAKSLTRNSSTELVATRPDALDTTDSPYTVKVVNPGVAEPTGSSAHLLSNSITAGANPSWVTSAAQTYLINTSVSITLSATDADGTVSYSLQSGTLPGGLSLNGSTGEISGTPTTSHGDVNVFTIRATDQGGNFVDREFTFTAFGVSLDQAVFYEFENNLVDSNNVAPALSVATGSVSYNTNGTFGGEAYTPDNNSVLKTQHPLVSGNAARTLSAWVYFDSTNGSNRALIIGTGNHGEFNETFDLEYNGYAVISGNGAVQPGWITVHTWSGGVRFYNQLIFDQWHHVAVVHDGGDISPTNSRLYINGSEVATAEYSQGINTSATGPHNLMFGGRLAGAIEDIKWSGGLDQVLLFPRALSAQEISSIHASNGLR